jgi:hypothetical protein
LLFSSTNKAMTSVFADTPTRRHAHTPTCRDEALAKSDTASPVVAASPRCVSVVNPSLFVFLRAFCNRDFEVRAKFSVEEKILSRIFSAVEIIVMNSFQKLPNCNSDVAAGNAQPGTDGNFRHASVISGTGH